MKKVKAFAAFLLLIGITATILLVFSCQPVEHTQPKPDTVFVTKVEHVPVQLVSVVNEEYWYIRVNSADLLFTSDELVTASQRAIDNKEVLPK